MQFSNILAKIPPNYGYTLKRASKTPGRTDIILDLLAPNIYMTALIHALMCSCVHCALPYSQEFRLLSRSRCLCFHFQAVNVSNGDDSCGDIPRKSHKRAHDHKYRYPEQVQVIPCSFLKGKWEKRNNSLNKKHLPWICNVIDYMSGPVIDIILWWVMSWQRVL